jgi:hypothetical protein
MFIHKRLRRGLDPKARQGVFIGYCQNQKAYQLWDPVHSKVYVSRRVTFIENSFTFWKPVLIQNQEPIKDVIFNDDIVETDFNPEPDGSINPIYQDESTGIISEAAPDESTGIISEAAPAMDNINSQTDNSAANPTENYESTGRINGAAPGIDAINLETEENDELPQPAAQPLRRSSRVTGPPIEFWKCSSAIYSFVSDIQRMESLSKPNLSNTLCTDINIPTTVEDAISGPFAGYWRDAIIKEYNSMIDFQTFETITRTPNMKPIKCKWIFTVKPRKDTTGLVEKFKARLVAKGFSQRFGIDYNETFAPVAHQESLRTLLAMSALNKLRLRQLDVVGAYLNGEIDEKLYMCQPEGFSNDPTKVWRLSKAIYGLKQAGCVWNKKINEYLVNTLEFKRCISDPCIYIFRQGGNLIIIGLYVDDMILAHNSNSLAESIVSKIGSEFQITDLNEPKRILGMNLIYDCDNGTISLNQATYIRELMGQFNMTSCKPIKTPHQPGLYLDKSMAPKDDSERSKMKLIPYGSLVGALNYISTHTRPDISTAVGSLCRYISDPGPGHWTAAKRVLQYLSCTQEYSLVYNQKENDRIITYSDADWGQDIDTRRSTTGYVVLLAGSPICWKSKRQSTVATSSVHAEYMALYDTIREVIWLRTLLTEIGFPDRGPSKIYGDNQGCLSIANNVRTDTRTKHIDIKFHFSREQLQSGAINLEYCPTGEMVADSLTKPSNTTKFIWCRDSMGIRDIKSRGTVEPERTITCLSPEHNILPRQSQLHLANLARR